MMPEGVQNRTEQVRALVRGVLGEELLAVTHQDFRHRSLTFDVALAERSIIVRTNAAAGAFAGTVHNLTILAGLDLPVPRVLAADLTGERVPFGWMILEKIPGRDLRDELPAMSQAQMTRLAAQIVGFQRRVIALPIGGGFGYAPLCGAEDGGGRGKQRPYKSPPASRARIISPTRPAWPVSDDRAVSMLRTNSTVRGRADIRCELTR